jgi:hypothetical protein
VLEEEISSAPLDEQTKNVLAKAMVFDIRTDVFPDKSPPEARDLITKLLH